MGWPTPCCPLVIWLARIVGYLRCTPRYCLLSSREWPPRCPCRERHGASVADTSPVRVGLLASADSNKVTVKSPVLLTSRDFALAEAWCFGNLAYGSGEDRGWQRPGVGRERVPMSFKTLSWDKMSTCCATKHPRMGDSALFVCSSFIVTLYPFIPLHSPAYLVFLLLLKVTQHIRFDHLLLFTIHRSPFLPLHS